MGSMTPRRLTLVLLPLLLAAATANGEEQKSELPYHHLSLFAGLGIESRDQHENEEGFAIGAGYELQFHEKWGVGVGIEGLGHDTIRNFVLIFPVSFHLTERLKLLAGPGVKGLPENQYHNFLRSVLDLFRRAREAVGGRWWGFVSRFGDWIRKIHSFSCLADILLPTYGGSRSLIVANVP